MSTTKGDTALEAVKNEMMDGGWHPLSYLSDKTGVREASVSARLRDLRKPEFGGHTVERQRMPNGHFVYRMVFNLNGTEESGVKRAKPKNNLISKADLQPAYGQ